MLDAFLEVMTSNEEGTKLALTQNVHEFREKIRDRLEISEMKADMEIIKKRLFNPRETDFKIQGVKGETHRGGGDNR